MTVCPRIRTPAIGEVAMKKKIALSALAVLALGFCLSGCRSASAPRPADFHCLGIGKEDGRLLPLKLKPERIYGMGMSYSSHIRETGHRFDPRGRPPIFLKNPAALNPAGAPVKVPTRAELIRMMEKVEPGLGEKVAKNFRELPALLDYEVELAFVLLEDVGAERLREDRYAPKLGYFLANDISARAIAVLGEGRPNRYDYWGASKSFPGFLPVGTHMWVPNRQEPNSVFCTLLAARVNGEPRQEQITTDMIYTPKRMLAFIAEKYPEYPLRKGDVVLTGTPGGVAMRVPAWKIRMADLFGLDRFKRLSALIDAARKDTKYLKAGDEVVISATVLGEVKTKIAE